MFRYKREIKAKIIHNSFCPRIIDDDGGDNNDHNKKLERGFILLTIRHCNCHSSIINLVQNTNDILLNSSKICRRASSSISSCCRASKLRAKKLY